MTNIRKLLLLLVTIVCIAVVALPVLATNNVTVGDQNIFVQTVIPLDRGSTNLQATQGILSAAVQLKQSDQAQVATQTTVNPCKNLVVLDTGQPFDIVLTGANACSPPIEFRSNTTRSLHRAYAENSVEQFATTQTFSYGSQLPQILRC